MPGYCAAWGHEPIKTTRTGHRDACTYLKVSSWRRRQQGLGYRQEGPGDFDCKKMHSTGKLRAKRHHKAPRRAYILRPVGLIIVAELIFALKLLRQRIHCHPRAEI